MTFWAFLGSFQRLGSSVLAFSSASLMGALSQSKMPPQQGEGFVDAVDQFLRFSAHGSGSGSDV
jgi:hypothetical protein